jgi:PAS domain S-box-containing protein
LKKQATSKNVGKIPGSTRSLVEALKQDGEIVQLMVDSVYDYAIFMLDPGGNISSWNRGAQKIKQYSADEIIGRHFSIFYSPDAIASGKPALELEIAKREGKFEEEGARLRKDGSEFWANVVITAVRDKEGVLIGFTKVTRDLTEKRAAQQKAIADARRIAEVETSNRTKSEFLASMSHELRTPLNAIGGYTDLLNLGLGGPITEEQRQYLERIRQSQQHLMAIITDLLNFSRIEAGHLSYDIAPIDLAEILDTVLAMVQPQAAAKGVELERGQYSLEFEVLADRSKVDQILLNLLSNAIKFTDANGKVRIEVSMKDERAYISVVDTGCGVPADKLQAIFEPFVQLGRSFSSAHQGIGLGLAISRDLAQAMNGDLTASSVEGSGSTFTLSLPRAP